MAKTTVLITGCSQGGIGDSLARRFASRGCYVYATVRDPHKAAHLKDTQDIEVVTLDVTSTESIQNLARELKARLPNGKLDILVNNAGFGATGPLLDADIAMARRVYDTNVFGLLEVTQAFMPMLIAAKGTVVNMSSTGSIFTLPFGGIYHSSKAAVTMLSETMRLELAPLGVTVVTGMLGHIKSEFHNNDQCQRLPDSSYYKPVESFVEKNATGKVAEAIEDVDVFTKNFVNDILKGSSGYVYRGAMARTCLLLHRFMPVRIMDMVSSRLTGMNLLAAQTKQKKDL